MNDDSQHVQTEKRNGGGSDAMPDPDRAALSDRDLLFGRLAVHNGFIDQASLEKAQRQVVDSSKSLGEHLFESGVITEDERRVIGQLAEVHIGKHDDDPLKSLSSIANTVSFATPPANETAALVPNQHDSKRLSNTFADYELLDEIAKGGMGVVYKARQTRLNRLVALKMIRSGEFADDEQVKRFYSEAEAAAKLDHAGIVPVHEVGEANGQHFYSMAFVDGQSLDAKVKDEGPLDAKVAVSLMKTVAEAVQFAHDTGIIHRDIKPQNILLDAKGRPRVTDFGLAKHIYADSELTATGQVMGTPSYMAPEQATGRIEDVGPISDVYALGATFYFLLTGRPPFQAASTVETIRQVIDSEPVAPRKLNPDIPRDLETICLNSLRKDAAKRYGTASELADDLGRWLENKPIVARPVSRIEKTWLWCKRRPAVAGLLIAIAVLSVFGTLVALERQNATHAEGLVAALVKADTNEVPKIVKDINNYRSWADPLLHDRFDKGRTGSTEMLHLAIALLPADKSKVDYLWRHLLTVPHTQFPVVRDALLPHKGDLIEALWENATSGGDSDRRFQAACALATYDPNDERWKEIRNSVADDLVGVLPSELLLWRSALSPVKEQLAARLAAIYRDAHRDTQVRGFATDILTNYLSHDADGLFELVADANDKQFDRVFGKLTDHQERAIKLGNAEVAKTPASDASEADKEALAMRQANAAVMLLRMEAADRVWPLLKHSPDPRVRSYIIHWLSSRGGDPSVIIARYEQESDVTIKRALLLSLGGFDEPRLPKGQRKLLIETLLAVYRSDPDGGLHAAVEWLLREWGQAERLAPIDKELQQNEEQLAAGKQDKRQWYINSQGQTFVTLDAGEFQMGSPDSEAGHFPEERIHRRKIGRRFAISAKEVTRAQWRVFAGSQPGEVLPADSESAERVMRTDDSPVTGTTWYEAAWYCNWSSDREGIPEEQWCYEPNDQGQYGPGMTAKQDFWKLTGYRLPTEAEWEFACRAGASTSRYYGQTENLLPRYAWYLANADHHSWPVASLKPNDFGLFDMQGNVWEWVYDADSLYPSTSNAAADAPHISAVSQTVGRVLRGGSFGARLSVVRSAYRDPFRPGHRIAGFGFRPARTRPATR